MLKSSFHFKEKVPLRLLTSVHNTKWEYDSETVQDHFVLNLDGGKECWHLMREDRRSADPIISAPYKKDSGVFTSAIGTIVAELIGNVREPTCVVTDSTQDFGKDTNPRRAVPKTIVTGQRARSRSNERKSSTTTNDDTLIGGSTGGAQAGLGRAK